MTVKAKAAIIGPGNIGTDLLMKCQRSEFIEVTWMVGIEESPGIQRAREFGLKTSTEGVDGLVAGFDESNAFTSIKEVACANSAWNAFSNMFKQTLQF